MLQASLTTNTDPFYSSAPLPPISRLEDRNQARKCVRLRKALKNSFADVLDAYKQMSNLIRGFSEQTELEKYYDMYDINDLDMSDALQGFSETEFEDSESLRTLKILAARFHTTRKMLLCALLALDANGEGSDLLRWTTAVEVLRNLNASTKAAFDKLQNILTEAECKNYPNVTKLKMAHRLMILCSCSISCTPNAENSPNTWTRALAIAVAEIELAIYRNSGVAGQASPA